MNPEYWECPKPVQTESIHTDGDSLDFKTIGWNALTESVADIEPGVSADTVARFTLQVAHEAARRLGGFRFKFNVKTTAHLRGGTVLVPVPKGWKIGQIVSPKGVRVESNLLIFEEIVNTNSRSKIINHGFVPARGAFVPPVGFGLSPQEAVNDLPGSQTDHQYDDTLRVVALLKPVMTEQCPDGLPESIFNNYYDVLLYGVLSLLFGSSGHIDASRQNKYRAEYALAIRQVRTENAKLKRGGSATIGSSTSFLDM